MRYHFGRSPKRRSDMRHFAIIFRPLNFSCETEVCNLDDAGLRRIHRKGTPKVKRVGGRCIVILHLCMS